MSPGTTNTALPVVSATNITPASGVRYPAPRNAAMPRIVNSDVRGGGVHTGVQPGGVEHRGDEPPEHGTFDHEGDEHPTCTTAGHREHGGREPRREQLAINQIARSGSAIQANVR